MTDWRAEAETMGRERVRSDLLDLALDAGRPLVAWCMACWVRRFAHEYRA